MNPYLTTKEFGNLYIIKILLSYGYPRVFVCRNDLYTRYLFYEMISSETTDTWLVTKLNKNDYKDILNKLKSIQSVYKNSNDLYSVSLTYNDYDDIVEVTRDVDNLLNLLPKEDVFYGD